MKFVGEYRQFAKHYRKLADKLASPKDKDALKLIARVWDRVAAEREDRLNNQAVGEHLDHARSNKADCQRNPVSVTDRFVARKNVRRFWDRLQSEPDPVARARLERLLVEEENKLGLDLEFLAELDRTITNFDALVQTQKALVATLERDGHDGTAGAQNLLDGLMKSQLLYRECRKEIAISKRII